MTKQMIDNPPPQGFTIPTWVPTVLRGMVIGLFLGSIIGLVTGITIALIVLALVVLIKIVEWPWKRSALVLVGVILGILIVLVMGESFRQVSMEDLTITAVIILLSWGW